MIDAGWVGIPAIVIGAFGFFHSIFWSLDDSKIGGHIFAWLYGAALFCGIWDHVYNLKNPKRTQKEPNLTCAS